ncbi:MAG: MaoC family dehydratase [Acetobacteraceae bacterium]|nr:MaoC family dehydratase [Acetobacteraceae bacterium]
MSDKAFSLNNAANLVGEELGISDWIALTQQHINQFADCTGDHQWIHVDVERARRESPFGSTVAHGYLTLSLLAPTVFEVIVKPAGISQALNYGLDRVRFIAPVKAGSHVRNRIKLVAVENRGNGRVLLTTENTIEVEGEPKPALIAIALVMVS